MVIAEVEPLQRGQVGERVDENPLDGALAHVDVLEPRQRREVASLERRPAERVPVHVQLDGVGRHAGRDGRQPAPRAVDDAARSVAEARPRARRSTGGRRSTVARNRHRQRQQQRQRRRQHFEPRARGEVSYIF